MVTMIGCAIAGVFAVLEFLYGTRQSAKDSGTSWAEEMRTELQFIFQCHGNTREVSARHKTNIDRIQWTRKTQPC